VAETRAPGAGARPAAPTDPQLVLSHLDQLPTLPAVAVRVLHLTTSATSDAREIADVLRGDPALTTRLLSLANSATAVAATPVTTVDQAVVRLGLATVRGVVLAVKVFECFPAAGGAEAAVFERGEFWKHCVAVACAARRVAAGTPALGIEPGEAFVAGLLHDIGKVALDATFPKAYARVVAMANEEHGDIADHERAVLGVDHTVAGRRLAERWQLPAALNEVVWLHHLVAEALPTSVQTRPLIALVQLADTFAREQRIGYSGNHRLYESSAALAERLGVDATLLEAQAGALVTEVADFAAVLGLDDSTAEAVYLQALARANSELARLYGELNSTNRRLTAGARYFRAITELDRQVGARADLPMMVRAIAEVASAACQRPRAGAFAVSDGLERLELCWRDGAGDLQSQTLAAPEELRNWLEEGSEALSALVLPAPRELRNLFRALAAEEAGDPWLLPIVHAGRVAGGICYLAEGDERGRLADEQDDLRSLLASLGLALGRTRAHAAAERLSDDLAENNRRLQHMQAEVLRTRTLASIAELAAGAGHELNSPLAVISGRAQMLMRQLGDPEAARALQTIVDKAHECSQIVNDLMDFAKPRPLQREPVPLGELLAELRDEWIASTELPAARIVLHAEAHLPPVAVDRAQLDAALRELLRNAAEATRANQGLITVQARRGVDTRWVEILVRDNGYGMTLAVQARAFDPFFSHRPAGRGRGLGLPRAHRIIDAHGGRIWIESSTGNGTTVHVRLPVVTG
jgi:putative nucleotidyltransferase with HDIG domain